MTADERTDDDVPARTWAAAKADEDEFEAALEEDGGDWQQATEDKRRGNVSEEDADRAAGPPV
jgi:hypothetical protein